MRALLLGLVFASSAPVQAWAAEVVSTEPSDISVTVYPDDLALVTETRRVSLPAGASTVAFRGVSDLIIPQSLVLTSFEGTSLTRNFDYNLLTEAALYETSVGETISLTRIERGSGRTLRQNAEVVSARPDGGVVVKTGQGHEALFCSGLAVRTGLTGLPPGLAAEPAMTIEVDSDMAGERDLTISYLTSGMGWAADYRLDLADDDGDANLLSWLSIENNTNKMFRDANLSVVAGEVARDYRTRGVTAEASVQRDVCYPIDIDFGTDVDFYKNMPPPLPAPMMLERVSAALMDSDEIVVTATRRNDADVQTREAILEEVGDYKLYRVPDRVTVAPAQTKQIAFLNRGGLTAEKSYALDLERLYATFGAVPIKYTIPNDEDDVLGEPLPSGTVRVFAPSPQLGRRYIGEDSLDDTPIGEDLEAVVGDSPDVIYSLTTVSGTSNGVRKTLSLTNATPEPAIVFLESTNPELSLSGADRQDDELTPTWRLTLPANGRAEVKLRYRMR